jgi:hypothetical protein
MSFSTRLSRLRFATRRFSFAFSCSSSFNRLAWSTCRPPYSLRQRKYVCSTISASLHANGVSSYEIHRDIGVSQKSAWFMLHRIREAMKPAKHEQLGHTAPVEIDETFIGGKVKNMHRKKRPLGGVFGQNGKTIVMGMLERGGKVWTQIIPNRKLANMRPPVHENIKPGSHIVTDEHANYPFLAAEANHVHDLINHLDSYVRGEVHTNSIENFWSCLKRGLSGTYISVEPFHLARYVEEQVFRFNNRKDKNDAGRFDTAVSQIVGRRLTYVDLTGKTAEAARPF